MLSSLINLGSLFTINFLITYIKIIKNFKSYIKKIRCITQLRYNICMLTMKEGLQPPYFDKKTEKKKLKCKNYMPKKIH